MLVDNLKCPRGATVPRWHQLSDRYPNRPLEYSLPRVPVPQCLKALNNDISTVTDAKIQKQIIREAGIVHVLVYVAIRPEPVDFTARFPIVPLSPNQALEGYPPAFNLSLSLLC